MNKKDDLFELVNSLNGAEKRYFKLFAKRHITNDENLYLELFNWLEEQNVYDEKLLKKAFHESRLLKQLPVIKNYLKKNILKSLKSFTQHQSVNAEVRELIDFIEILFKKRLFNQCDKLLRKAIKLSTEHEHFNHLLILHNWEMKIAQEIGDAQRMEFYLNEQIHQQFHILEQIRDDLSTRKTAIRFIQKYESLGKPLDEASVSELQSLMQNQKSVHLPLSHRSTRNHYIIQCLYNEAIGDFQAVHQNGKLLINEYFTKYQHKILPNAYDITDILNQIIRHSIFLNMEEDTEQYLCYLEEHFQKIPDKEEHKKIDAACTLLKIKLYQSLILNQENQFLNLSNQLETLLTHHENHLNPQNLFDGYVLLYQTYFIQKKYEAVLEWNLKILNQPKGKVPQNIIIHAEIFQILTHFELANHDVMFALIRSFRRKHKSQKAELIFELALCSKLLKMIKTPNQSEQNTIKYSLLENYNNLIINKKQTYPIIEKWIVKKGEK